jgi:hypothetical protein
MAVDVELLMGEQVTAAHVPGPIIIHQHTSSDQRAQAGNKLKSRQTPTEISPIIINS